MSLHVKRMVDSKMPLHTLPGWVGAKQLRQRSAAGGAAGVAVLLCLLLQASEYCSQCA